MTFPGYILEDDLPRKRASHLSPSRSFRPRGLRLRERERLRHENGDLRSILKQYLDGISVNEEVINAPNPLLVVNHRTNVVANPGRTQPVATTVIEGAHASRVMSGSLAFGLQGASL